MFLKIILSFFIGYFFQSPTFDPNVSSITYAMRHKFHAWEGTSNQVNVAAKWNDKKQLDKIVVSVKVSSFNSGLSSRDSHMLEILDAITHPNITFSSTTINYTDEGIVAKGKLQFHGITRDVQTLVKVQQINNRIEYSGTFPILLEDYQVTRPSLMFVKTDNQVGIRFKCVFAEPVK